MTTTVWPTVALSGHASVPGSKPHMQRALILALLSEGHSSIYQPAWSAETLRLLAALEAFGLTVLENQPTHLTVAGTGHQLRAPTAPIHCDGSAFMFRCLVALACIADGATTITGNRAMKQRPMLPFLNFVHELGATVADVSNEDQLRLRVCGTPNFGGSAIVDTQHSSQFLTSLLLVAPLARKPIEIQASSVEPVGEGYIDLTLELMSAAGAEAHYNGGRYLVYPGGYRPMSLRLPSDFTALSYLASSALSVTEAEIVVDDYTPSLLSSERVFFELLREMGIEQHYDQAQRRLLLRRESLADVRVDASGTNMPTVATMIAGASPYVHGTVQLHGIGHINHHKCRRLEVIIDQLRRMGCTIDPIFTRNGTMDGFVTRGRQMPLGGVELDSFDDHRVFAGLYVAALGALQPTFIEGMSQLQDGYVDFLPQIQRLITERNGTTAPETPVADLGRGNTR